MVHIFLTNCSIYNNTHLFIITHNCLIFINNHYLYTCTSITICIFVGNLVTEIYFQQEVIVHVLCGELECLNQPTRLWICHPLRSFLRKYIPRSDLYSPPSASWICISLLPFLPPISSSYPFVPFTQLFSRL